MKTRYMKTVLGLSLYCPILNHRGVQAFTSTVYLYLISYPTHVVFYEYQKTFYLAVPFYKWYMYTGCQYVCDNPEYVQAVVP